MTVLEERERVRLAQLTNVDAQVVERIIAAATDERIVVVLPAFDRAEAFAGWEQFAYDAQAKAAHLAEAGAYRALCGAPRPFASVTPAPRTRLCGGCEWHVRALTQRPSAVRRYNRGDTPRPLAPLVGLPVRPAVAPRERIVSRLAARPAASAAPAPPPDTAPPSLFGAAPLD